MSDKKTTIGWAQQPPVNHPAPQPQQQWPQQPAPQPQYVDPYGRQPYADDHEQPTHARPRVPQHSEPPYAPPNQYPQAGYPQPSPHYAMGYPPYGQDPSQGAPSQAGYDAQGQGYAQPQGQPQQGAYDAHGGYAQPQGQPQPQGHVQSQAGYDAHGQGYAQGQPQQGAYDAHRGYAQPQGQPQHGAYDAHGGHAQPPGQPQQGAYDAHGGHAQPQGAYDPHGQVIYPQPHPSPAGAYPSAQSPSAYDTSSQAFYDAHEGAYAQGTPPQPAYSQDASGYPQYTQSAHGPAHAPPSSTPPHGERTIPDANATVGVSNRVRFIRLTYLHLLFSILAFSGLLYLFMTQDFLVEHVSIPLVKFALGGRWNWGVVLAVFMGVSYVAEKWSHADSRGTQYAGLLFYILAESLIFVPLLAIVEWKTASILARGGTEPHIIRDSAFVTLAIFTMLTLSVFISKKDFSFMRSGLMMASGAALALIFMSLGFGFNLGLVFSVAMVLLAAGYILYYTSQVLAHYDTHQHVGAALALFSAVALMFWYVIRIFLRARE